MSVPDELVEVAARVVSGWTWWVGAADTDLVRAVLSAVSEAGYRLVHEDKLPVEDDGSGFATGTALIRQIQACQEARAQAEALAEALDELMDWQHDYPTDMSSARTDNAWSDAFREAFAALRAFRESKETGDVR